MPSIGLIARFLAAQIPFPRKQKSPACPAIRDEFAASLGVMRLESRRVLNAANLPVGPAPTPPPDAAANAAAVAQVAQQSVILTVDASQQAQKQGGDLFVVKRDGDNVDVTINGSPSVSQPLSAIGELIIKGSDGDDKLVIDYSGGDPLPSGGIQFDGGQEQTPGGDQIIIEGGPVGSVTYNLDSANSGVITIDGASISFTGVESVLDSLSAASRSFYVAAGGSSLTLGDGRAAGTGEITTASGMVLDFADPTSSLTVGTVSPAGATTDTINVSTFHDATGADLYFHGGTGDTLDIAGNVDLGAANLTASAGTILVSGSITSAGGTIELDGSQAVTLAATARIQSTGGSVIADAGAAGTLLDYGVIDVSDTVPGAIGGSVELLGEDVGLGGSARVDASGSAGGGTILVGGDAHGAHAAVRDATQTFVGQNVTLKADAVDQGHGGKVVVWSDEFTQYYGSISARGGLAGGDGGWAEVSGGSLTFQGTADLSASSGQIGTLLLDPANLTITHDTTATGSLDSTLSTNNEIQFGDDAGGTDTVTDFQINQLTGSIILQATDTLTSNADSVITLQNDASLTLETQTGDITLNGSMTASGTGTITIHAGETAGSGGSAVVNGSIATAGGAVAITADGSVAINSTVNANTGPVTLTAGAAITETGGAVSTSGLLTTSSVTGTTLGGANTVGSFNATNTTSGDVSLTNTAATLAVTGISETGGNISVGNTGNLTTSGLVTDLTAGQSISLSAAAGTLTIGAAVTGTTTDTISLMTTTSGDIAVNAAVSTGSGEIDATSAGQITETAGSFSTTGL
ncbi:MAG TPA: hypothetical protein VGM05_18325, partial [Planctomycetaceae bacterium]